MYSISPAKLRCVLYGEALRFVAVVLLFLYIRGVHGHQEVPWNSRWIFSSSGKQHSSNRGRAIFSAGEEVPPLYVNYRIKIVWGVSKEAGGRVGGGWLSETRYRCFCE